MDVHSSNKGRGTMADAVASFGWKLTSGIVRAYLWFIPHGNVLLRLVQ